MSAGTGGAAPLVSPAFLLLHSNTGSTHATLALRALHPVALGESAAWLAERCSELRAFAVHHSSGAWQVPYWVPLVLTLGIVGPNDLQAKSRLRTQSLQLDRVRGQACTAKGPG